MKLTRLSFLPQGHDVRDEGDVVCDGVRSDEDVHEKAKFMLQTLAFNRKVGPEILETGLEKNKVDQGCIYFLLAKDNRRLGQE